MILIRIKKISYQNTHYFQYLESELSLRFKLGFRILFGDEVIEGGDVTEICDPFNPFCCGSCLTGSDTSESDSLSKLILCSILR